MVETQSGDSAFVILLHRMPFDTRTELQADRFLTDPFRFENRRSTGGSHWDLMFQVDQELETWAVQRLPQSLFSATQLKTIEGELMKLLVDRSLPPYQPQKAIRLKSHRIGYLSYQGPVSQQRGSVDRFLRGTYRCSPPVTDFNTTRLSFEISQSCAEQLKWMFNFHQPDPSIPNQWELTIAKLASSS